MSLTSSKNILALLAKRDFYYYNRKFIKQTYMYSSYYHNYPKELFIENKNTKPKAQVMSQIIFESTEKSTFQSRIGIIEMLCKESLHLFSSPINPRPHHYLVIKIINIHALNGPGLYHICYAH